MYRSTLLPTRVVTVATPRARPSCQCAACVDEYTGRPLLDPATIAGDVEPVSIETKGNYAVGVTWSDGHTSSIYKYETLHDIVKHSKDASD